MFNEKVDFKNFYEKYKELVFNLALNYTANKEDAEEIAQDVFETVFKKLEFFRYESKIETWIYRITINKSLDYLRSKKRLKNKFLSNLLFFNNKDGINEGVNFNHPGVEFENKESVQIIYKCLDKLPNNYKTVIVLLKIEGEPQKKVAEIMNISEKAVESLFFRAKLKLKDLLEIEKDI